VSPGGDLSDRKNPDPQLRQLRKDDACQRLQEAIGTAFGGFPYGVRTWPLVLRGPAGQLLVSAPSTTSDLLVTGAERKGHAPAVNQWPGDRCCLHHAHCPVLAVPPPALARQASHGLRGWASRHRGLDPDSASLPDPRQRPISRLSAALWTSSAGRVASARWVRLTRSCA